MSVPQPLPDDYRIMALDQTTADLFDLAERAAQYRAMYLLSLELLADREKRLTRSRECFTRLRDENRHLRGEIMRADAGGK